MSVLIQFQSRNTKYSRNTDQIYFSYIIFKNLTPQEQSSERNLPGTIVPWRDLFDNDVIIPKEKCSKFSKNINAIIKLIKFCILHLRLSLQSTLTFVQTQNVSWRDDCPWGVNLKHGHKKWYYCNNRPKSQSPFFGLVQFWWVQTEIIGQIHLSDTIFQILWGIYYGMEVGRSIIISKPEK